MRGLIVRQFRALVLRPVLERMGMHSPAAENLLLGTALVESGLAALAQVGGPALGLYQMEPATHDDIWDTYLARRQALAKRVVRHTVPSADRHGQLVWNLAYATVMCRIHYWRRPEPLPAADDVDGLAAYWKQHYNTPAGKGTMRQFIEACRQPEEK